MAYRLARKDKSVECALQRIAGEQIAAAVHAIDDAAVEADITVHELRKHCKKIRGLLRLVRPAFEDYDTENAAFRDIASAVSAVRDTDVLIATYDAIVTHYRGQIERRALGPIRRGLTIRRNAMAAGHDPAERLSHSRMHLLQAAQRVNDWRLQADGFTAMQGGLGKTFRRARKAMHIARESPSPEHLHEWRKRCKYHWYHARLLQPIWPGPMKAHVACAHELGDVLGQHHDLAVFLDTITAQPGDFGKAAAIEAMAGLVHSRQALLTARACALGARLFAESPTSLKLSWGARFDAWRND